ncbi:MAG: FAD-dependent oxidoreductase [Planctomycetes bacterium]|nr:FAD-dependent oxidoreductase [Planctomycetota bacterium]MCW8135034.1 FAD-dependent oxidoreductase [Planctomycetota bacterium]
MAKPAILVVDDEPEVLRAIARDLRAHYGEHYRVLRAQSGTEALDALRELQQRAEPVALLLSDQRMPGMEGTKFLALARELFPAARRVLLTAYADTSAAIASINDSHVDYYLLKPWDPPQLRLFPALDDLLEKWRGSYRPGWGGVRIFGNRWSAGTHAAKEFLSRNQVPYQFHDVAESEQARQVAGDDLARLPVVILENGKRLIAPDTETLAREVGMRTQAAAPFYDLAIVGAGPAGLAAAVYAASEGLSTVLIEREAPGGQAGTSSLIENYLGFPGGLSGAELARRALAQAQRFGVEVLTPADVTGLTIDGPYKKLRLRNGAEVASHLLMLSMGVSWRQLNVPGAHELTGRGVYYGAALTEAEACQNRHVYVVGAGNSAGQAAMFFADYAEHVTMLVRGEGLDEKMSSYLVQRIEAHPKITVLAHTEIARAHGTQALEALTLRNRRNGEELGVETCFLFSFIGAQPRTDWLGDAIARDEYGFVLTGPDLDKRHLAGWPLEREPFLLECNVPGVFAAGDVRSQSIKRVASAVGEGSVSVAFMHRHLAQL